MNPSVIIVEPPAEIHYPDGDGKPMAETGIHVLIMMTLIGTLREYYRHRRDVYVIGNIFLYYEEGNPKARRSPDVMVVKGVDGTYQRRSFKTWEERAVPSLVIEITSDETADEDRGPKRELYERLGVREYFLFDPLQDYLERPLMGYRLIGDKYEPLPPAEDGGILSAELGLRLVPDGENLTLIDFRSGEHLLHLPELNQALQETREQVNQAEQRAGQAEQHAVQAKQHAVQAEQHAVQAEQRADQAEQHAVQAEQRAGQAEQRAGQAEQRAGQAEQRAGQAEQRADQAEQRAGQAEQRAGQLAEELARLRTLLPPDAAESDAP